MESLTDTELTALAAEVDVQLNALQTIPQAFAPSRGTKSAKPISATARPQQAVIEQATGENFATFWQKFRRHAHRDLCLPGGVLHDHWQKWKDLDTKDTVKSSCFWLAAMGISAQVLNPVAVAATVILLNAVLNIGIQAICEECGEQ